MLKYAFDSRQAMQPALLTLLDVCGWSKMRDDLDNSLRRAGQCKMFLAQETLAQMVAGS